MSDPDDDWERGLGTRHTIQIIAKMRYVRLKVTISLYLSSVVSTLLQFIVSYNEEYFVLSAPSKSRSVKPSFLNSNYESKNSSVASDYEKCPKAVQS